MSLKATAREAKLVLAFSAVALLGFATDGAILTLMEHLGLGPAYARAISLPVAMQVTFLANGLLVFRNLIWRNGLKAWAGYMLSSGLGNGSNYLAFIALASLHSPLWSNRWLGLAIGGGLAWTINYLGCRLLVFGPGRLKRMDARAERGAGPDALKDRPRLVDACGAIPLSPLAPLDESAGGST
jgi:putative flippase GtrA